MGINVWKRRDLAIVDMGQNSLVIACDSCGGVGKKENDVLKAEPSIVGAFSVRVVLMEVLAAGAEIVSISNAVCNEMNGTGIKIINGIRQELIRANLATDLLTGSTEENFKTSMTAVGVTAVGVVHKNELRFNQCKKGDCIIHIGIPKVGAEVTFDDNEIASYDDIRFLLAAKAVREIVPVGSKGIQYEAELLAEIQQLKFVALETEIDLLKSAGPATCMIAAVSKEYVSKYNVIGKLL